MFRIYTCITRATNLCCAQLSLATEDTLLTGGEYFDLKAFWVVGNAGMKWGRAW